MSRRKSKAQQRREAKSRIEQLCDVSAWVRAAAEPELPDSIRICSSGEDFEIQAEAAPAADGKTPLKKFSMTAYTGGAINVGFGMPVVVDLEGMSVPRQANPVLKAHDPTDIVGHTDKVEISAQRLKVSGSISNVGESAAEVKARAAEGFPWQVSMGASVQSREYVDAGKTVMVNGRNFSGPLMVARKTTLGEVSLVAIGADQNTSATIAASAKESNTMNFEAFIRAAGFDPATITDAQRKWLKAQFDAAQTPPVVPPVVPPTIQATGLTAADIKAEFDRQLEASRAQAAAEIARQTRIRQICANPNLETEIDLDGKKTKVNILAHATAKGWTPEQTELAYGLESLRAQRPVLPGGMIYSASTPQISDAVLEAAVLQAGRCELFHDDFFTKATEERDPIPARDRAKIKAEMGRRYPDQVQQTAHDLFKGRIGLQQLFVTAAASTGNYHGGETIRDDGQLEAVLRASNWIRADGASTVSIANVLANVLNKQLLAGYLMVEQTYKLFCGVASVKDFKPTKSVNLFGDFQFQGLGPDGELKNATLQDQAFANQADTLGRIMTLTRKMMINDDLSALVRVPMLMGRGAGLKINDMVYTVLLAAGKDDGGSTDFFAATHTITGQQAKSNLSTGAGSALSSAGLTAALLLWDNQVDPNGDPLGFDPSILLYPSDLDTTARELMNGEYLVGTGQTTTAKQPNTNIWKGRYTAAKSRYINKTKYTGYSTAKWWLMADPGLCPVIEICYVNGQDTPMVQTAEADFKQLGVQVRGFFDAGVAAQNFRGAVQSNGS